MRKHKIVRLGALIFLIALVIAAVVLRPDRLARVASALAAHTLCSGVFVSAHDPKLVFEDHVRTVLGGVTHALRYRVLQNPKQVEVSVLGAFRSSASFVEGFGCRVDSQENVHLAQQEPPISKQVALPVQPPVSAGLEQALSEVFREHDRNRAKKVQAVVIMKAGHVVAERYAPGVNANTPLLSYSIAKSFTNAFLGILVRKERMSVAQSVEVPEWNAADDPRRKITVEDLLRMQSGIDAEETGTGSDPVSQMEFLHPNMAAFAAGRPLKTKPGVNWDYTSANTMLLARLMQRSLQADALEFRRFARRELFDPAGMGDVVMEVDGAGIFVGSTYVYATARDYAKFGELYRNDGVAPNGQRVLPEGWVEWSKQSTRGSSYGAGWWTNAGEDEWTQDRIKAGFPKDGLFASGFLGQRIYIVPSEGLVITRFGYSAPPDFGMPDDLALIRAAIKLLK